MAMVSRNQQFLEFFERERVEDQVAYYRRRAAWHRQWDERMIVLTGVLMFLAAVSSAIVAAHWDHEGPRTLWIVLATLAPVLSSAVAATRALYEHERNHIRFDNTYLDLKQLRAARKPSIHQANRRFQTALAEYVSQVEGLLSREHRQWTQTMQCGKRPPQSSTRSALRISRIT